MQKPGNLLIAVQNRRGVSVVIVAICLVMLIGFAALAIDVGYLYSTRNELQNVADAAALAGAGYLGSVYETLSYSEQQGYTFNRQDVVDAVNQVAQNNKAAGVSISIREAEEDKDIVIGKLNWDYDPPRVDPATLTEPDAVQVIARRDRKANNPVATFFAPIFKLFDPKFDPKKNVNAIAIAALTGSEEVKPGELKVPFGVSLNVMENCTDLITFSPTTDSCAGWHNFGDLVTASKDEKNLFGIIQNDVCGDNCGMGPDGTPRDLLSGAEWLEKNFDLNKTPEPLETGGTEGFKTGQEIDFSGGTIASLFNGAVLDSITDGGNNPDNYGTYTDPSANPKIPSPFFALFDYFRYRDGDTDFHDPNDGTDYLADQVWTAVVPVYVDDPESCVNPSADMEIAKFVTIKILMPNPPPDKTVKVYIDCNQYVIDGRGGGGTGPTKGTIPQLVR